jgi:TonB family protein
MAHTYLIIENPKGEAARVLPFFKEDLEVVYRHDSRRIELVRSTDELEENEIAFDKIADIAKNSAPGDVIAKGSWGKLKHVAHVTAATSDTKEREDKDKRDFPFFLKWTAAIQASVILVCCGIGYFMLHHNQEEPQTVMVFQRPVEKQAPVPVVNVSEHKIKQINKIQPRVAKKAPTKPKNVAHVSVKTNGQNVRSGNDLSHMGALSALGGMNKNSHGLGGLSQAASNSSGFGFDSARAAGGNRRGMLGKGLMSGGIGSGETLSGYGGYGTKGRGQGQAGYGVVNMAGRSGGYYLPLSEDAVIEGGLDRDQINAVVQRNLGQVRFCYENALQVNSKLSGRVAVRFVISPAGAVSVANVAHSSMDSSKVESCIVSKLKAWQFPRPRGNVAVKVEYPFNFQRANQG